MFGARQHGRRFDSDEVKNAVHMWLRPQPETLRAAGIRRLVSRYKMHVKKRLLIMVRNDNTLHLLQVVGHGVFHKIIPLFGSAYNNMTCHILGHAKITHVGELWK